MSHSIVHTFSCDFETTVYEGQTSTEVWASACVELGTEDVHIFHSIGELFEFFKSLNCNVVAYFHNLKFDGQFWMSYLMYDLHFKQAFKYTNEEHTQGHWLKRTEMLNNTYQYGISDMGQWYTMTIKVGEHFIDLKDSLKLLPFSVKEIGKAFNTKHQKLDMEYTGFRYSGCTITDEEKEYIANDVLVVKEALEIMFEQGHKKLTIGSCCLNEFKKTFLDNKDYQGFFPNLLDVGLDESIYGYKNVDAYIRRSYKGGWCYVVKGKENHIKNNGTTADVNSLYPSMMSSESGNRYPYGKPKFWKGNYIPEEALKDNMYYFVRVKTRFYLKPKHLPFIQIKGNWRYKGTECLATSDVYNAKTGKYYTHYTDINGVTHDTRLELVLTMTDYQLLKDHYELVDFEILDGCMFRATVGLFDEYIEKYKKQKLENKGALRTLAKLFLNNLYGKMASSDDSSFKLAVEKDDGVVGYIQVEEHEKKIGYIPVGSAITSYARNFTIRAAQANYYGVNERGFIYADTDSIHCDLEPNELVGIKVHDKNFCCWKLESCWDVGIFARQKTYIEHVTHEDLEPIEKPYYNVKCAGMPSRCKDLFVRSLENDVPTDEELEKMNEDAKRFLFDEQGNFITRTIDDFKVGLIVPGKLIPRRIRGGVLLVETSYEMR